jgi:tetratricopeptide (TPR) repeat protein
MASDYFYKWYGMKDRGTHYGETFWKARRGYPEALPELIRLASDTAIPDMVRSTAYQYLSGYQDPSIYSAITSGVADPDPLIRFGAFEGGENITEAQKTSLYRNLLRDSVRLIRTMAARNMPQNAVQQLNGAEKTLYGKVFEEYMETEMVNSDHPFSWMNIGNYYLDRGDFEEAEKAYRRAILIEPYLPVSYINLTDLYRRIKMDARGEETLKQALVYNPGSGDVHHSLGLLLIRNNRTDEGIEHLKQAAELSQQNTRYAYVYGVALFSTGAQTDAIIYLENARKTDPFDRDILFALVSYYGEMGQLEKAVAIAEELAEYYPADQTYREVVNQLRALQNQIP